MLCIPIAWVVGLLLTSCQLSRAEPPQNPLYIFEIQERIAASFDVDQNTNYTGTICPKHQPSVLASLTELAALPETHPEASDHLRNIYAQATQATIDLFRENDHGFLIGLHGCRIGSPSHSIPGTHFYVAAWGQPAQQMTTGQLHTLQRRADGWLLLLDKKGSTAGGPIPYDIIRIEWMDAGWQTIEHSLAPDPYSISKMVQTADGTQLDLWVTYWSGEQPCTLTEAFTSEYFLHMWDALLTYDLQADALTLRNRQIISWELWKDGGYYETALDWQQYCLENNADATPPSSKLVKSDGPAVYLLNSQGILRHIPSWADFVALGYDGAEITTLTDTELAGYPIGWPLTADSAELLPPEALNPLSRVSAVTVDGQRERLWIGTSHSGVAECPWTQTGAPDPLAIHNQVDPQTCLLHTTFTGDLLDNTIRAVVLGQDDSVWALSPRGVSQYGGDEWVAVPLAEGVSDSGGLSLAALADGHVWVGGDGYLAHGMPNSEWQVYTAIEQPLLDDSFARISIDERGIVTFWGQKRELRFDGLQQPNQQWTAASLDGESEIIFLPDPPPPPDVTPPPLDFPDPLADYQAWLQTWPRPADDNGRCMHFVQTSWLDVDDAQRHIDRLVDLGVRWTVVPYANHFQLRRLVPLFEEAEITVIWRPFVRPYESYQWWAEDIAYLRERGIPPYMQLYNEPSLRQEWERPGVDAPVISQDTYLSQLNAATREVYEAGGYVGLQLLDLEWTKTTLQTLKAGELNDTFDRLFFIPHPYGLNHPPEYDEDESSVLGFRFFADVFEEEIGFIPMMIAGEGGWRPNEQQDDRYPPVSVEDHRDYHVAVFEWFRSGELSNGEPLPDYLFAFCPWLIADPVDSAGWYDSQSGDRTPTIEAVQALSPFVRRFSWD